MAEIEKLKNMVAFRKQITTDGPQAYAEAILKFDGLPEQRTAELREKFNSFFEDVEKIVKKETSLARKIEAEKKRVLTYKDGRPSIEDKEV